MSRSRQLHFALVFAGTAIVVLALWLWPRDSRADQKNTVVQAQAVPVKTAPVSVQTIPQSVGTLGSLVALQVATISAQENGRITAIHFKDGQQVASGMPIVQMDNAQAQADYVTAVAAWQLAVTKYNRSKLLINEAISLQDLAALKADMDSKNATVHSTQAELNAKQIVAPFSGVLGAFQVAQGDYVSAGTSIVTLVNSQQLKADYKLAQDLKAQLQLGQLVAITSDAYPNQVFYGTVSFISPTVNQDTRSIDVEATINNKDLLLAPGMFVQVSQQIGKITNALVIPDNALQADIKGYFVYKLVNNHAVQTYVQAGQHLTGQVQIVSGLQPTDIVVAQGQQNLDDGSLVQVMN